MCVCFFFVQRYILRNFPFDAKKNLREFISLSGAKYVSSALVHIAVLEENDIPKTQPEMTVRRCFFCLLFFF